VTEEEILDVAEETIQHQEESQKNQSLEDLKERKMGMLITVPLVKSDHKVTIKLKIRC
jgi:predicted DNA binding CopG/RHH family protein